MKQLFTLFFVWSFFFTTISSAQTDVLSDATIRDTVHMGAGRINDVYFDLQSRVDVEVDRSTWDLAFTAETYSGTIWLNDGLSLGMANVLLYQYPDGDINSWNNVDISNIDSWTPLYNSIHSWDEGAFNRTADYEDPFDVGWGNYNMANHNITGDSIYVIAFPDGTYKKLAIVEKTFNSSTMQYTWNFKYANIDGTEEVVEQILPSDYPDQRLVTYSIQNQQIMNNEPLPSTWDLKFTKYADLYSMGGATVVMPLTGVLHNRHIKTARYDETDTATTTYNDVDFDNSISKIGWCWWEMGENYVYYIVENQVFFINDTLEHKIYKFVFDDYYGSLGDVMFRTVMLRDYTNVELPTEKNNQLVVYPNPASEKVSIIFDFENVGQNLKLNIFNITGKIVHTQNITNNGFGVMELSVETLPQGTYIVQLQGNNYIATQKLIITK